MPVPRPVRAVVAAALFSAILIALLFFSTHKSEQELRTEALQAIRAQDRVTAQKHSTRLHNEGYTNSAHLIDAALVLNEAKAVQALELVQPIIDDPQLGTDAKILAGQAYFQLGDFKQALGILKQAEQVAPDAEEVHRWLSVVYYDLGAMPDALHHLERLSELDPEDYRSPRLMGLIHQDFDEHEEAIKAYAEASTRKPPQHVLQEILTEWADSLIELERPNEARALLESADPTPLVLTLRAKCHWREGDAEQAESVVEEALRASPELVEALNLNSQLAMEANEPQTAKELLLKAKQKAPKDRTTLYLLGQAYSQLGEKEKATDLQQELDTVRQLRQRFSELHDDAMAKPTDASVRFQLGETAAALEQWGLARMWYQAALSCNPDFTEASQALQQLPQKAGAELGRHRLPQ